MTTLTTRQTFALVALFVATSLGFIQLDGRRTLDPVKDGLQAVVAPAVETVGGLVPDRGNDSALERELEDVKTERDQLQAQIAANEEQLREIDDLRLQAGLAQDEPSLRSIPARVLGSDPSGQELFVTINKGSGDGIAEGMAVTARGPNFVGLVTDVAEHTARVTLLIDRSQAVAAKTQGGADGIVYGMSRIGSWLELRHLNTDTRIAKDELVLTADNEAINTAGVPGGLIIGRVDREIEAEGQGDSRTVEVVPDIDYERLEVVAVVQVDGG